MRNTVKLSSYLIVTLLSLAGLQSCRKEEQPLAEETVDIAPPDPAASPKGFYLLNEGNMNANKASLDYVDFRTGKYRKNIYNTLNPDVTKGLGDVGNDIAVYGSKLYVVVNVSNKVEVLDVKTARRVGQIDILNCRYITFHDGKAYVSAYLGSVGDAGAPNGIVAEIDTVKLNITRKVEVGRQPEEMAVMNGKLYVANSGGYSPPDYERTVSVIDLLSFREVKKIDVAINLHHIQADKYGDLYVTSRGDYYEIPSRLFVIDTKTDQIKKSFDVPVSRIAIHNDLAYLYSTEWSYAQGGNTISYNMLNVKDEVILNRSFITDGTEKQIAIPYGIKINPSTSDIYVTDARDYLSPGFLHCYSSTGRLKWSAETGDIPAHIAFVD